MYPDPEIVDYIASNEVELFAVHKQLFGADSLLNPSKWVLLSYNKNGKPLEWEQIQQFPELSLYLESNKDILQNRRGLMLKILYLNAVIGGLC